MGAQLAEPVKAYLCECGKKWTFRPKTIAKSSEFTCDCGRTIVIRHGVVFSTGKPDAKGA
ncbi:MAG TPA: hypothetical protein VFA33_29060 [Bryobacteraceae bacterium]|nr:hypothetical protein [Bryobacteraceae bacterium]